MKIRCDYCGNYLDDSDDKCFSCGAPNQKKKRTGNQVPKTIEELKQWYINMHLPDENTTRFFIGRDYPGPKAFGIYKQADGDFVVYKNKSDGTRATRYVGKDEEYAVQEIYLKLKEEMQNQKMHNEANTTRFSSPSYTYTPIYNSSRTNNYNRTSNSGIPLWLIVILIIIFISLMVMCSNPRTFRNDSYSGYSTSSWSDSYYDDYDSSSSWSDSWSSSSWDSGWDSSSSWDSGWSDWDSDW